jgi:hypothetical protein
MKKRKNISLVKKLCVLFVCSVSVFSAGFYFGARNVALRSSLNAAQKQSSAENSEAPYTVILSSKWLYVYDGTGALHDSVYVYSEYLTDEDKNALSNGVEFESAEKMIEFMKGFK